MALQPLEFHLTNGETIAGVEASDRPGHFTMVFLHEAGGDLDILLPIMSLVGLPEARKVAVDLPGHGLSSGQSDQPHLGGAPHFNSAGREGFATAGIPDGIVVSNAEGALAPTVAEHGSRWPWRSPVGCPRRSPPRAAVSGTSR